MGKRLVQQRRGRGTPRYVSPIHKYRGFVQYPKKGEEKVGKVVDIVDDPMRMYPLMLVDFEGTKKYLIAPSGIGTDDDVYVNDGPVKRGAILPLSKIPEGIPIFNIEIRQGDGGRMCRSPGSYAMVVGRMETKVSVQLPSKKIKKFDSNCRATIGVVAGGGVNEKPFVKAGAKHYAMKVHNRLYPIVSGRSMNSVDHPFGGSNLGKAKTTKRIAPSGRKVGSVAAKRTGKKKR